MLRDRGLLLRAGTVVLALGGVNPLMPPWSGASWRHVPWRGTVGPRCPLPPGSGASLAPCSPWYGVTTNPHPFPTRCMRGDVYVAPGLPYGNRRR